MKLPANTLTRIFVRAALVCAIAMQPGMVAQSVILTLPSIPPFGRGFSIRWRLGGARTSSHTPVHRLDEPTGISLGMVASPQCPLPFRPAKSL